MKKLSDFFKSGKGMSAVIVLLAVGVFFMLFAGTDDKKEAELQRKDESFDFKDYENYLEKRISEKINSINGASECETIVFIDTSFVYEYVRDESGNIFVYEISGSELAIVEKETAPTVRGVAVVCKGGNNSDVKKQITEMLTALLDIPSNNIWVGGK